VSIKGVYLYHKESFILRTNTCVSKHLNVALTAKLGQVTYLTHYVIEHTLFWHHK